MDFHQSIEGLIKEDKQFLNNLGHPAVRDYQYLRKRPPPTRKDFPKADSNSISAFSSLSDIPPPFLLLHPNDPVYTENFPGLTKPMFQCLYGADLKLERGNKMAPIEIMKDLFFIERGYQKDDTVVCYTSTT